MVKSDNDAINGPLHTNDESVLVCGSPRFGREKLQDGSAGLTDVTEVEYRQLRLERVVLVGDAAHATAPTLSQGAAMAVEDAVVLAAALRRGGPVPEALAA